MVGIQELTDDGFRGAVTLVDFWAKWCSPCMLQDPVIKRVFEKVGYRILLESTVFLVYSLPSARSLSLHNSIPRFTHS